MTEGKVVHMGKTRKVDYMFLEQYIPESPGRIHMKDLASRLGLKDTRELRQVILAARINGVIICADNDGYFLPTSDGEIAAYFKREYGRAITTLKSLKHTRKYLKTAGFGMKRKGIIKREGDTHG